jgi:adenylosuccinate lyase
MTDTRLHALSPLDGRYAEKCADLAALFSEAVLIGHRVRVEAAWFAQLARSRSFPALASMPESLARRLDALEAGPDAAGLARVKELEREINHDVKAVEYYVRDELAAAGASPAQLEFVHFACTSEDINNLCYAQMLAAARERILLPAIAAVADHLAGLAGRHAALPMLSRTHGQPASPTTLGKEAANFAARLRRAAKAFARVEILGKFNGAVGGFNAHVAGNPSVDWRAESRRLIEGSGSYRTSTRRRSSRTTGSPSTATRSRAPTSSSSTCAATFGATSRSAISRRRRLRARSARQPCRTR